MICGSSGCQGWDACHRHQELGSKISLQVVLLTLYVQFLNCEVPKSAFWGTSGPNQASKRALFKTNKHPITPVGLLMSGYALGIHLLRTKANTKKERYTTV